MNILNIYNEFDINNFDLSVDHYGSEKCDRGYSFGPTIRDNYVIHFILEGKGKLTINQHTLDLAAGDIFLLPKDISTFYQADLQMPWSYIWIGFSGSKAENILKQSSLFKRFYCHSGRSSKLFSQMMTIIQFANTPLTSVNELLMVGELYKLLAALIEEFPLSHLEESNSSTKAYVNQVKKIIHSQYGSSLRVNDIAKKLNLSRSYLYKIFRKSTNLSIKEYILQVRMKRSQYLLENPKLSIAEISNSVGISDSLAFSKAFKNYFGKSPSKFRKEIQNN